MPLKETDFDQGDSLLALAQFYLRNVEDDPLDGSATQSNHDAWGYRHPTCRFGLNLE